MVSERVKTKRRRIRLAIDVGGHISKHRKIQTASESSLKHLKGMKKKQSGAPNCINTLTEQCYKNNDIEFIESHAEQRKQKAEYTTHKWGNLYADKVSKLRMKDGPTKIQEHSLISKTIEIEEVLYDIMETRQWYWGGKEGKVDHLGGPMMQIQNSGRKNIL